MDLNHYLVVVSAISAGRGFSFNVMCGVILFNPTTETNSDVRNPTMTRQVHISVDILSRAT